MSAKHFVKLSLSLAIALGSVTPVFAQLRVITPPQGGTGIGSATAGDVGDCVKVLDDSPFTYELGTCGAGSNSPATSTDPLMAAYVVATSTTATSTFPRLSITTGIEILGEYFENFTNYVRSLFSEGDGIDITSGQVAFDCTEVEGTGINCSTNDITLDATGNWSGTFDLLEGTAYLDRGNHSGTQLASTISDFTTTSRGLFSAVFPLSYSSGTGVFSLTQLLATSSIPTVGNLAYWTGNDTPSTLGSVATSTVSCTSASGITCTGHTTIGAGDTVALSAIPNSSLANSTISGIALGSSLANLTATDGSLTFSGTYNGGTARTIGLNLGNANTWTALQTFANASSTLLTVSNTGYIGTLAVGATSTPGARFSIAGQSLATTPLFLVSTSTASATTTVFSIDSNGLLTQKATAIFEGGIATSTSGVANNAFLARLTHVYSTSTAGTTTVQFTGARHSAPTFSAGVFTLPLNTAYIHVKLNGAGGGGSGGGTSSGNGTAGGRSCFGTNSIACVTPIFSATGGAEGDFNTSQGGAGGTGSGGDVNMAGNTGGISLRPAAASAGANGGAAALGGGGGSGVFVAAGTAGSQFGGGGGGGGISASVYYGAGGGGGGYASKIIYGLSGTYYFTVGAGGVGGAAGGSGFAGAVGGPGGIIIEIYTF